MRNNRWGSQGLLRGLEGEEKKELSDRLKRGMVLLDVMEQDLDRLTKQIFLPVTRRIYLETADEFSVERVLSVINRNARQYREANNVTIDIKFKANFCDQLVKYFQDHG